MMKGILVTCTRTSGQYSSSFIFIYKIMPLFFSFFDFNILLLKSTYFSHNFHISLYYFLTDFIFSINSLHSFHSKNLIYSPSFSRFFNINFVLSFDSKSVTIIFLIISSFPYISLKRIERMNPSTFSS